MASTSKNFSKKSIRKSPISGQLGSLTTRLAQSVQEIEEAQRLRYQVFFEEMSAQKSDADITTKRDQDAHDEYCDHLLVIDKSDAKDPKIIGTQRFLVQSASNTKGEFYSQKEFDLDALSRRFSNMNFMELGRSCILPQYRSKRTMELMWHGTWAYALHEKVDVMVGCASFEATSFDQIAVSLGFLAEHAACKKVWDTRATSENSVSLQDFYNKNTNPKKALAGLPPLIKGYLRLGAKFASKAVQDTDFGTIDVLVVLPVTDINPRYVNYYGADASKHGTQTVDGAQA